MSEITPDATVTPTRLPFKPGTPDFESVVEAARPHLSNAAAELLLAGDAVLLGCPWTYSGSHADVTRYLVDVADALDEKVSAVTRYRKVSAKVTPAMRQRLADAGHGSLSYRAYRSLAELGDDVRDDAVEAIATGSLGDPGGVIARRIANWGKAHRALGSEAPDAMPAAASDPAETTAKSVVPGRALSREEHLTRTTSGAFVDALKTALAMVERAGGMLDVEGGFDADVDFAADAGLRVAHVEAVIAAALRLRERHDAVTTVTPSVLGGLPVVPTTGEPAPRKSKPKPRPDHLRVVEDGEGERMREEAERVRDAEPRPVPAPPPVEGIETVHLNAGEGPRHAREVGSDRTACGLDTRVSGINQAPGWRASGEPWPVVPHVSRKVCKRCLRATDHADLAAARPASGPLPSTEPPPF